MPAILIVDDNPVQAATRRLILEKVHFNVLNVDSGALALERYDSGEPFGLIITDHCMPEMSGPEFVKKLRERSPSLPIVVLSGLPEADVEYVGLDVQFRLKPIHPDELIALARTLLFPPYYQTA